MAMSSSRWLLVLMCTCITLCLAEKIRYDGYQVLRAVPKSDHDVNIFRDLMQNLDNSKYGDKLSFWREPSNATQPVDIMVSPTLRKNIIKHLDNQGIYTKVMIKDVQKLIDQEQKRLNSTVFDYNTYNTYDMIQEWITETAATYATATKGSLGTSYEGRNIGYLKISTGPGKMAVVIHGGIHAREWISPATVIYLAKYLVEGGIEAVDYDFYIIPVLNVDGYEYTWTNDRLWRKTRKPNMGSPCVGTDPNRNFGTGWGGDGSSNNPCAEDYHGTEAFSEPEVAAIRDFVISLGGGSNVVLYIDYHSYSQLWMMPYGYTPQLPPDIQELDRVASGACDALFSVHGTVYEFGTIYNTLYPASGVSCDFMYAELGVIHAYTSEGRDTGTYGFLLPEDQIQPSGEENWAALLELCNSI